MRYVTTMWAWMALRNVHPELAVAQLRELRKQVPLLYALLSVNAVAVAYTHLSLAPRWMTIWIPACLVAASVTRMVSWLRMRGLPAEVDVSIHQLRRTVLLAALLAIAYISWALGLSQYGGDREQAHVAIFIAITVIGCIFCLMSLPQAALAVTALVTVPSLYYYLSMGDTVYAAIGINIALVTMVIIQVVFNGYGAFVKLVNARSETERLNREVTVLAHTDALTGLPNRRLFFADLPAGIVAARGGGTDFAVGVIDLDRFKSVNDSMGHLFGDQLLQHVGSRLQAACPADVLVARLGGDEFAFQAVADGQRAKQLGNVFCELVSRPYVIDGMPVTLGATCGIALLSTIGEGASLYDAADYALYKGKFSKRGFVTAYAAEHEALIRSEQASEAALQSADLGAEIDVHFQPIVDRAGRVTAVEALARWTSPVLGAVSPDIFIPLAERTGIIHRLTLVLFRKAIEVAERLPGEIKLSFNLSAHDLTNSETVLALLSIIRQSALPPARVIFELTETAVMRDYDAAEEAMLVLRRLGVEIALDDFGTGQSSLSYLRRLPINKVKIDRSFVMDADNAAGYDLLAAIIALCGKMKITCIAEGIESGDQLDALMDLGCDGFQGYYFERPLSREAILPWLSCRDLESLRSSDLGA